METDKIYEGDCLEVLQTFPDGCVDCIITSPPYPGVNNMWGELYQEENFEKAHDFLEKVWLECIRVLKPGCKIIINIANTKRRPYLPNTSEIYQRLKGKIEPIGEIIWNKGYGQCGTAWGSFRSPSDPALADQHEYILVFRKYGDRNKPDSFDKIDLFEFKSWRNTMWKIPPAKASKENHCAPFPIKIPFRLITLYTFENEVVLDPFAGSGTTALASKYLNRRYVGIEHNPEYVALINKKISQETLHHFQTTQALLSAESLNRNLTEDFAKSSQINPTD